MRYLIFILLVIPVLAGAQSRPKPSGGWKTSLAGGVAIGQESARPVVQLGGGYQFRELYAGLGGGYDRYRVKSFPLFAELRYQPAFAKKLYLYTQGGYNLPAPLPKQAGIIDFGQRSTQGGGFYSDYGVGIRFPVDRSNSISIAAGFSSKWSTETSTFRCWVCQGPNMQDAVVRTRYDFHRAMLKMVYEVGW